MNKSPGNPSPYTSDPLVKRAAPLDSIKTPPCGGGRRGSPARAFAAALLVTGAALSVAPLAAQQELRVCEQAVSQLISANSRLETQSGAQRYGFEDRSIAWRAADGSSGICRVDSRGRVYAVEVERFGWSADTGTGGAAWSPYSLTCESQNGRRRECPIRDPSSVRLTEQLSRGACREAETWGFYGDRLWVDEGCRGVFLVSPVSGGQGPGWSEETAARAARASCESKARQQGMQVTSASAARRLNRQSWRVDLKVALGALRFDASCTYNERTGHVEIFGK